MPAGYENALSLLPFATIYKPCELVCMRHNQLNKLNSTHVIVDLSMCTDLYKGRGPKKTPYFLWSFAKPGGGGTVHWIQDNFVEKK